MKILGARFQARISPGRGEGAKRERGVAIALVKSSLDARTEDPAFGGAEKKLRGIEQKGRGEAQCRRTGPQESR